MDSVLIVSRMDWQVPIVETPIFGTNTMESPYTSTRYNCNFFIFASLRIALEFFNVNFSPYYRFL